MGLARERKPPRNSRAITPRSGEISGLVLGLCVGFCLLVSGLEYSIARGACMIGGILFLMGLFTQRILPPQEGLVVALALAAALGIAANRLPARPLRRLLREGND